MFQDQLLAPISGWEESGGRFDWESPTKKGGGQIIIVVEAPLCAWPVGLRQIQLGSCAPQRTLHHSSSKAQLVEQNSHELSLNWTPRPMTSFDVDQGNGSAQGNSLRIAVGKWGYQQLHVPKHKSAELWSWLRRRLTCPSTTAFCRFEMLWVSFYSSASNFWWVCFQPVGCHTKCTVADNSPQVNQLHDKPKCVKILVTMAQGSSWSTYNIWQSTTCSCGCV